MTTDIRVGDVRDVLPTLADESAHCVVTSPPYWGLRDYGVAGQLGLERTPDEYVENMVDVFREVRRVLRDDGTLWLNLGDGYAGSRGAQSPEHAGKHAPNVSALSANQVKAARIRESGTGSLSRTPGLKAKDLIGMPWRVAFALQADGWFLRADIIWAKPNPMPESVRDRPTKAHEYVFLLSKSERYYYDAQSVAEPVAESTVARLAQPTLGEQAGSARANGGAKTNGNMKAVGPRFGGIAEGGKRNARSVWTIATQPYRGAHFATMPPELAERCILAGSKPGDTVLDPFGGAGTTGLVADRLGRDATLIELNPEYAALARSRITSDAPLFADGAA